MRKLVRIMMFLMIGGILMSVVIKKTDLKKVQLDIIEDVSCTTVFDHDDFKESKIVLDGDGTRDLGVPEWVEGQG